MYFSYDNNINIFVLLPVCFVFLTTFSYFILKKKTKTIEFKVAVVMSFLPVFIAELAFIQGVVFQNFFFSAIPLYGTGVAISLYVIYYTTKIIKIKNQEAKDKTKNFENIIKSSSQSSVNVANIATELAASASEVNAASEEISATTIEINSMAQEQVVDLDKVFQMANKINNIAKVITNISNQTNLLALNASIEAGRAGEHGRGFAVVAEKVQKLAEESKTSVEETNEIVGIINSNISNLTGKSKKISEIMESVSASAEEQTASMEEITSTASRLGSLAEGLKQTLVKFK